VPVFLFKEVVMTLGEMTLNLWIFAGALTGLLILVLIGMGIILVTKQYVEWWKEAR